MAPSALFFALLSCLVYVALVPTHGMNFHPSQLSNRNNLVNSRANTQFNPSYFNNLDFTDRKTSQGKSAQLLHNPQRQSTVLAHGTSTRPNSGFQNTRNHDFNGNQQCLGPNNVHCRPGYQCMVRKNTNVGTCQPIGNLNIRQTSRNKPNNVLEKSYDASQRNGHAAASISQLIKGSKIVPTVQFQNRNFYSVQCNPMWESCKSKQLSDSQSMKIMHNVLRKGEKHMLKLPMENGMDMQKIPMKDVVEYRNTYQTIKTPKNANANAVTSSMQVIPMKVAQPMIHNPTKDVRNKAVKETNEMLLERIQEAQRLMEEDSKSQNVDHDINSEHAILNDFDDLMEPLVEDVNGPVEINKEISSPKETADTSNKLLVENVNETVDLKEMQPVLIKPANENKDNTNAGASMHEVKHGIEKPHPNNIKDNYMSSQFFANPVQGGQYSQHRGIKNREDMMKHLIDDHNLDRNTQKQTRAQNRRLHAVKPYQLPPSTDLSTCDGATNYHSNGDDFLVTSVMKGCRPMSWSEAVDFCHSKNMAVVSFGSSIDDAKANRILNIAKLHQDAGFWTGGYISHPNDKRVPSTIVWASKFPETNFTYQTKKYFSKGSRLPNGSGQPDNYEYIMMGNQMMNENCVAMMYNHLAEDGAKLHDLACHHQLNVVCEKQKMPEPWGLNINY